jgi:hypothetical protein
VDINVADPPLEEIIREIYLAEAQRHGERVAELEGEPSATTEEEMP